VVGGSNPLTPTLLRYEDSLAPAEVGYGPKWYSLLVLPYSVFHGVYVAHAKPNRRGIKEQLLQKWCDLHPGGELALGCYWNNILRRCRHADCKSLFHQYVRTHASGKEAEASVSQQLDKDLQKAELLWPSRRARVLRRIVSDASPPWGRERGQVEDI